MAVEDDVIEPPVVRKFNAPKGEWVTLEVDLKKAVEVRQMDLSKITNFWLMGRAPVRTTVRIDNVRISKRDVDAAYKVLRDDSSMAVTKGDREIFFIATVLNYVLRWDGESWHKEAVEAEDGGMLSLAGEVVTLFDAGRVNRRWKERRWERPAVIRCQRRGANGQWDKAMELTEKFNIDEYRALAGYSVPPYSPSNFIPLAYSNADEGRIKLLKVPVTEGGSSSGAQ